MDTYSHYKKLSPEDNQKKYGNSEKNNYLDLLGSGRYWRSLFLVSDSYPVQFQGEWSFENNQLILTDSIRVERFDVIKPSRDSLILVNAKYKEKGYGSPIEYIFTRTTAKGLEKNICKTKLDTLTAKDIQVQLEFPIGMTNEITKTLYSCKVEGEIVLTVVFTPCLIMCNQREKDTTKEGIFKWSSTHRLLDSGYDDIILYEKKILYGQILYAAAQFFYHEEKAYYIIAESPYLENTSIMVESIANKKWVD